MAEERVITDIHRLPGRQTGWGVVSEADGKEHFHGFPPDIFENRAAEYGIDPSTPEGLEEVIDMVLHELFVPDPMEDPVPEENDPAMKQGMQGTAVMNTMFAEPGDEVPITLLTASSTEEALEAHRLRIAHAKETKVRLVSAAGKDWQDLWGTRQMRAETAADPLQVLRDNHGIDMERWSAKRDYLEQFRDHVQAAARRGVEEAMEVKPQGKMVRGMPYMPIPDTRPVREPDPENTRANARREKAMVEDKDNSIKIIAPWAAQALSRES